MRRTAEKRERAVASKKGKLVTGSPAEAIAQENRTKVATQKIRTLMGIKEVTIAVGNRIPTAAERT